MSTHPAGGVVRDAMGLPIEEARRTIRRGAKELPPWIPATPPDELFESAQVIGAFFPRADGLEPAALPRIPGGCQLAFPRVQGEEMSFRVCDPSERVASGSLGIFEAPAHATTVAPDILFIPALTVDRQGHRLGRGRGHYDRYLSRARPRYTVALVRDALLLDRFPPAWTRDWDQPVDAILTESQFLPVRTSL